MRNVVVIRTSVPAHVVIDLDTREVMKVIVGDETPHVPALTNIAFNYETADRIRLDSKQFEKLRDIWDDVEVEWPGWDVWQ